jgi:hypothetical protein
MADDEVRVPLVVKLCQAMIGLAAYLVPSGMRADWKREWRAEIWHQWQFLFYAQEWNREEALRLLRTSGRAFSDAVSLYRSHPERDRRRLEWVRSPWTTLGVLFSGLLLVACLTSGFSATRLLATGASKQEAQQVFLWMHSLLGARDKGLPSDVVPAWAKDSKLLQAVAPFDLDRRRVNSPALGGLNPLVVDTEPSIFSVLQMRPFLGKFPKMDVPTATGKPLPDAHWLVIDYRTWQAAVKSGRHVIGSRMRVGSEWLPVAAVLPKQFYFLSRHPLVLLVHRSMNSNRVMVAARAKPNITKAQLYRELIKIAEESSYVFLAGQLRIEYVSQAIWAPVQFFGVAVLAAILMAVLMCKVRFRNVRRAWTPAHKAATLRRMGYFLAKTILAFALVLLAGLEWSRPESSILLASKDAANGLFLVWFFVAGTMGALFWSIADQRARCKECLRLLCSPVRIGCPGCLLLNWSGTELLCSEGHGILHVPELASTWDIDSEQWITLDDSWRGLFADSKSTTP